MDFPIIHTNFWDAVISIPLVMVLTQLFKWFTPIKKKFVPLLAVIIGLFISILFSHPNDLVSGIFMGYFYGYSTIGSYAATRNSWRIYRSEKHCFTEYENKKRHTKIRKN
ncbi:hypothetical protein [Terribacillus saccharophilus]|uniref:hypothetical protein n=1 Tax=Terribacillus saccharophilus TaxID=361277 RepID=UPI000C99A35F|nr:hypothetical protein [Terribacillus goriensis]